MSEFVLCVRKSTTNCQYFRRKSVTSPLFIANLLIVFPGRTNAFVNIFAVSIYLACVTLAQARQIEIACVYRIVWLRGAISEDPASDPGRVNIELAFLHCLEPGCLWYFHNTSFSFFFVFFFIKFKCVTSCHLKLPDACHGSQCVRIMLGLY